MGSPSSLARLKFDRLDVYTCLHRLLNLACLRRRQVIVVIVAADRYGGRWALLLFP